MHGSAHTDTSGRPAAVGAANVSRRAVLFGAAAAVTVAASAPRAATAGTEKEATVINDPAGLKQQLQAQYAQWGSGAAGFEAWLSSAKVSDTVKWSSTYNGGVTKFKGKAGARQYYSMLTTDLELKSYKPLAIFVDNDGDEATVVVEAAGTSRRTGKAFSTVLLHKYAIGPMGLVIKFKEETDTALLAQLVPPTPPAPDAAEAEELVVPRAGSAALKA